MTSPIDIQETLDTDREQRNKISWFAQQLADLPEDVRVANPLDIQDLLKIDPLPELVTPEKAQWWLDHNPVNRRISDLYVTRGIAAMERGEWRINGQSFAEDEDGNLVDGQHRAEMLVQANMAIWAIVVRGLPPAAREVTDTGKGRKLFNMLEMRGEVDPKNLAACLGWLWRWENGRMVATTLMHRAPSIQQGLELLGEHPNIRTSMPIGRRAGDAVKTGRAVLGMLHYVLSDIDAGDTEEFFARMTDGQALLDGDPIYVLRRTLINLVARKSTAQEKAISGEYVAALTIKAWNAYRKGITDMQTLSWRRGGRSPEPFPDPIVDPM